MRRITITLDDDVLKEIQKMRGQLLIEKNIDKNYTQVINELCREGLNHLKFHEPSPHKVADVT